MKAPKLPMQMYMAVISRKLCRMNKIESTKNEQFNPLLKFLLSSLAIILCFAVALLTLKVTHW